MSDRTLPRALLAVALLSGIGLILPVVWGGPLVQDEHVSYWVIDPDSPGTLLERSLEVAAVPPLSHLLERASLALAGKSELAFRAPSVLCYLLAIVAVYFLGRELLGPAAGGVAAIALAWYPAALDEVRIARCYGLVLLLAAVSLWMTVHWTRGPTRPLRALAWALAAAALLWTHYTTLPLVALEWLVVAAVALRDRASGPRRSIALVVGLLAFAALTAPLVPALLRMWEWRAFLNYRREEASFQEIFGPVWWLGFPLGWLTATLLARSRSVVDSLRESTSRRAFLWLILWGLLPLLLFVLLARGDLSSLANPRYRVAYAVPCACLIAAALTYRKPAPAALAGLAVTLAAAWWLAPFPPWQPGRLGQPSARDWKAMAQFVEREGRAGEPVFVQSGLIEAFLVPASYDGRPLYQHPLLMEYLACRLGRFYLDAPHPRSGLPFLWNADEGMIAHYEARLQEACRSKQSVWIAAATDTDLNRSSLQGLQILLQRNGFTLARSIGYNDAVLMRYECPQARREGN